MESKAASLTAIASIQHTMQAVPECLQDVEVGASRFLFRATICK